MEPVFLEFAGGFVNPAYIMWSEYHPDGMIFSIAGKEKAGLVVGENAATLKAYLKSRTWRNPAQGAPAPAPTEAIPA